MAKTNNDLVFDCQVDACKEFFQDTLPCGVFRLIPPEKRTKNMTKFAGPIYDITGFDARQVVAVLSDIVNNKCPKFPWEINKTFYLLIQSSNPQDELEELFKLRARPTKNQPGNGIVFLRPRGKERFKQSAKKYDELNGALKAFYDRYQIINGWFIIPPGTKSFAVHTMLLFQNNAQIGDLPQATFEVYMILLFEIARRLVTVVDPTGMKMKLDVLPIGSAIARVVQLLFLGNPICHFEDVFLPGGRFHCFTGQPVQRRKAIDNINAAYFAITKQETFTKEQHLEELRQLFCFVKPLRKMRRVIALEEQARQIKNLLKSYSPKPPLSVAEFTTAFDHCTEH